MSDTAVPRCHATEISRLRRTEGFGFVMPYLPLVALAGLLRAGLVPGLVGLGVGVVLGVILRSWVRRRQQKWTSRVLDLGNSVAGPGAAFLVGAEPAFVEFAGRSRPSPVSPRECQS